jgi:hypothetical protein
MEMEKNYRAETPVNRSTPGKTNTNKTEQKYIMSIQEFHSRARRARYF